MKMIPLALLGALSLSACENFTTDQIACVITGVTSGSMSDPAQLQTMAAQCGVTVADIIDAFKAQTSGSETAGGPITLTVYR